MVAVAAVPELSETWAENVMCLAACHHADGGCSVDTSHTEASSSCWCLLHICCMPIISSYAVDHILSILIRYFVQSVCMVL